MSDRSTRIAARLHWALLPVLGVYYAAEVFGEPVPWRWRLAYRLMKVVERLPGSELFEPVPPIVCDCDYCRGVPGAEWTP